MTYDEITETINEHGVSWSEVDTSNYSTTDEPAVRRTSQNEWVFYVNDGGLPERIKL